MSFLQNFHLSPGQTIRSTRGFKWNTAKTPNNGQDQYSPSLGEQGSPLFSTPQKTQSATITDFNYTPSHQKPYLDATQGTTVSSHKDLKEIVETTLGSHGVLNQAVKLPKGENVSEWIAVHCVDFYNQINMLYGAITEFCSPESCPRMIATSEYEYLWYVKPGSPPLSVSAPKYVEYLMKWCQEQFDDEAVFPSKPNVPFAASFADSNARPILKRLFRIYAHIYCHHFNEMLELNLQTVLNTSFRHFCLFTQEFQLLKKQDYGPLIELVQELKDR
ncbi:LAME_0G13190g1_1 [Lachancea meyersii CBS 8951]|uniref:LAME_0G13190g1_1 n=1 Tax=Lachancea meyersii CBS 8951 TaxID=1266667 RepID=A0A1G4K9X4_9SACH|nr:LAME_0G13190g1_1 [Lachancea meyersii CBS 8951]